MTTSIVAAERGPDSNTNQNQVTDTNIDVTTTTTIATTNTVDTTSSVANRTANSGTANSGSFCLTDNPHISELSFADGKEFQYSYNGYWMYLVALVIFYSLPVYQLMLTYQRVSDTDH